MRITLVADIKHKFVFGRIKNIMKCYSSFDESEIGTDVSSMLAYTVQHSLTSFICDNVQLFQIEAF